MKNNELSFEEFVNRVMHEVRSLEPDRKFFCLYSLHNSFFRKESLEEAAKIVLRDSKYYEPSHKGSFCGKQ